MNTGLIETILGMTNRGLDIFKRYMPVPFVVKKPFRSPWYDDKKPSCTISLVEKIHRYYFTDFGDSSYHGDCFWLVGQVKGLDSKRDFRNILSIIIKEMNLPIIDDCQTPVVSIRKKENLANKTIVMKDFKYIQKKWSNSEIAFWLRYGITQEVLDLYDVIPLSEFSATGENSPFSIKSTSASPLFGYRSSKYMKIYRPYAVKTRFYYGGQKPETYVFGFPQLPPYGNTVIITGGEKDVLSWVSHGFNAVCFNSETAKIEKSILDLLKVRFRHIFVIYDCDDTGRKNMAAAESEFQSYNIKTLLLPLSGEKHDKDISDFFASGRTAEEIQELINERIESHLEQSRFLLQSCLLDFENPPQPAKPIIKYKDVIVSTEGNLLNITGTCGSGKSHFVGAMLSGALLHEIPKTPIDTFGFDVTPNYDRKAVLYFDTEQNEPKLHSNVSRILSRARLSEKPDYFIPIHLMQMSRERRLEVIMTAMDEYANRFNGIYMVAIDGIADLLNAVNIEEDGTGLIQEVYSLAAIYRCCLMEVCHLVPNGNKMRGHLGSEGERKGEATIIIEREPENNRSIIKIGKLREGDQKKIPKIFLEWDEAQDMFVTYTGSATSIFHDNSDLKALAISILGGSNCAIKYTNLTKLILEKTDWQERKAKTVIKQLTEMGVIVKGINGYTLKK